jgi:hypothetical protein
MADTVRAVSHYTVDIAHEVGAGAKLMAQLRSVNFIAVWGYATGSGRAKLELIPEDAAAFSAAVKSAGIEVGAPATAFYLSGTDRPGAMAETLEKLAAANVGLEAAQGVSDGSGHFGAVFFVASADAARAGTALGVR